jgi:hypothetical protein
MRRHRPQILNAAGVKYTSLGAIGYLGLRQLSRDSIEFFYWKAMDVSTILC